MSVYSEDSRFPNALPWPYMPCLGLDGDGEDIGPCVMVNTDNGQCAWHRRDEKGAVEIDYDNCQSYLDFGYRPLPITFHPFSKPEPLIEPTVIVDG